MKQKREINFHQFQRHERASYFATTVATLVERPQTSTPDPEKCTEIDIPLFNLSLSARAWSIELWRHVDDVLATVPAGQPRVIKLHQASSRGGKMQGNFNLRPIQRVS